jgi:protein phosphatase
VGASGDVVPDIFSGTVRAGDTFLLASDGLTGMVEDDGLMAILQTQGTPERWVDRMVAEANRRGGLDNITAIIVAVDSVDAVPAEMLRTGESHVSGG